MVPLWLYGGILPLAFLVWCFAPLVRLLSARASRELIARAEAGDEEALFELIRRDLDGRRGVLGVAADSWHYLNPLPVGSERTKCVSSPSFGFALTYEAAIGRTERAAQEAAVRCPGGSERVVLEADLKELARLRREMRIFIRRAIFTS